MKDPIEPHHEHEEGSIRIGLIFGILTAILVSWFCFLVAVALGCLAVVKVAFACFVAAEAGVHWLSLNWDMMALGILGTYVAFKWTNRLMDCVNSSNLVRPLCLKARAAFRRL